MKTTLFQKAKDNLDLVILYSVAVIMFSLEAAAVVSGEIQLAKDKKNPALREVAEKRSHYQITADEYRHKKDSILRQQGIQVKQKYY